MLDLAFLSAISHAPAQLSNGPEFSTCCDPSQYCEPSCNACVVNGCGNGGVNAPAPHTTALGAGPEVYNNMEASHNCVGGSEQGCIPDHPPVGDPSKTGMTTTVPDPAHWYANGERPSIHTSALGAGPEKYNCMSCSHNCVGGSEQGCIPSDPPVGDASKTGQDFTLPPPASWYANGEGAAMAPAKELAVPAAMPVQGASVTGNKVAAASPGHLVMGCHAFTLAALQGIVKGDFKSFKEDAAKNAEAVTPVGALLVRKVTA